MRSAPKRWFLVLLSMGVAATALAQGYAPPRRVEVVQRALTALRSLGAARDPLEAQLASAARQRCASGGRPPRLACLLDLGQQLCQAATPATPAGAAPGDAPCATAIDVMLVNLRSANELVDEATRTRLVRTSADYHAALVTELRSRYAALAAELVIEDGTAVDASSTLALAESIDRFCARRDHRPKPPRCNEPSPTCIPAMSWQRCVAALSWFVTATPGGAP